MVDAKNGRSWQLGVAVLVALAALTTEAAWGQAEDPEGDEQIRPADDEIIVRGRQSLRGLRFEVQAARERIYDLFSAINDNDAFDIRCRNESRIGTRVPQRVCRPRYADEVTSEASRDVLSALLFECTGDSGIAVLSGGCAVRALSRGQWAHGEMHAMDERLTEEIERIARESPEFRRAIVEYQALERRYEDSRDPEEAEIRASIAVRPFTAGLEDGVIPPKAVELALPEGLRSAPAGTGLRREGWVKLRYSILADGTTADVRVVDVMPPGLETSGAVVAVEAWRFEPATADGTPIDRHNNVVVIVFSREEPLFEASPDFAEAYEQVAALAADGSYEHAKSRIERMMQGELASRLYEMGLAQMQRATFEHALGDLYAALAAIYRATEPGVPQLEDEELKLALEHRFALDLQLGRVTDALETYERRIELERLPSDHVISRQAAALVRALAAPETDLAIKGRIDSNGRSEHALTWPIFAVGDVDGRVENVGVECNRNKAELPFDAELEVSIPAEWGECSLTFEGRPGTTFTLYEFREPAG